MSSVLSKGEKMIRSRQKHLPASVLDFGPEQRVGEHVQDFNFEEEDFGFIHLDAIDRQDGWHVTVDVFGSEHTFPVDNFKAEFILDIVEVDFDCSLSNKNMAELGRLEKELKSKYRANGLLVKSEEGDWILDQGCDHEPEINTEYHDYDDTVVLYFKFMGTHLRLIVDREAVARSLHVPGYFGSVEYESEIDRIVNDRAVKKLQESLDKLLNFII